MRVSLCMRSVEPVALLMPLDLFESVQLQGTPVNQAAVQGGERWRRRRYGRWAALPPQASIWSGANCLQLLSHCTRSQRHLSVALEERGASGSCEGRVAALAFAASLSGRAS